MEGVGALGFLLPKLVSMLADEYNLQKGAKEGIRYIREELESMQVALQKVSQVPPDQLDPQVKLWASKVRDMSYQIEDTVDSYMVTVNPSVAAGQPESSTTTSWGIDIRGMLPQTFKARHDIATEIERIRKEVEAVAKRREMYKVDSVAPPPEPYDPRLPALYQDAAKLVGIDHSTEQIMELLSMQVDQGASTKKMPNLVSIVGPGGMGKTTLANVVYQKLKDHFDCTAFVSVSLKPNIENILGSILRQVNKSILGQESHQNHRNADNWSEKETIDKIREVLADKRYLIVIDDIWEEPAWEHLKCILVPNRLGSKIITTTRNTDVAQLCCSCDNVDGTIHQLEPLSKVESENLFYYKVFGRGNCPPELKDMSRKILGKCKGWPLAIISIASLLANKRKQTEDQWLRVYNSMGRGLENTRGVNNMRFILSLSYCDMPSQLRVCFLYLSIFPEDHVIGRDDLIWRWIAEGFVHGKQDDNSSSLYEVGDEYFDELINRNMIQPAQVDTALERAQACTVHDVVLEFINFLSAEEGFVTILNGGQPFPSQGDNIHRLSLRDSYEEEQGVPKAVKRLPHVRTLVSSRAAMSMPSLSIFPLLRVLDLENCTSHNIKNVGILLHLRYLKLSRAYYGSHIELPQGIGALQFLQILDLKDARIQRLPATLVQLIQLRVLKLSLHSWDRRYEKHLIQCLCNLNKLESLYISAAANVSLDFMLTVKWATPYLRIFTIRYHGQNEHILRPGSVWRELSSFSTLPSCINYSLSSQLSDLSIMVRKLKQEDVDILARFPILVTLDLEVVQACEEGRLVISGDKRAFRRLSNLKFASRALGLVFTPGAMQKLHKLYLCFSIAHTKDGHDLKDKDFHFGLENLTSLKAVGVEIDCRCAWRGELEVAEAALRTAANSNQNQPAFDLRIYFEREMLSEAVFSEHEGSSREVEEEPARLSRIGPWGGNGGGSHDIRVPPHRLETVTIHSGDLVDSLAFSYSDHNGQQCNAGPWGGHGGDVSTIRLGPSEYLTQVSGTIGSFWGANVVKSLTLVTNVASYGPFGKDEGENQFVVQARRNSCIVGFFGRSGILVDSIGFYARPL